MRWVERCKAGRLVVTKASAGDGPEVYELVYAVLAEGRYFIADPDELGGDGVGEGHRIEALHRTTNSAVLVGRLSKTLVGVVRITGGHLRRTAHVGYLEIYVCAAFRGQGLGFIEEGRRQHEYRGRDAMLAKRAVGSETSGVGDDWR